MNDTTKEKILKISHKLFADKGYNGVSIRELAKACDVNIAAINYHFSNKENLYKETILDSMQSMENDIARMFNELEEHDVEALAINVFRYFIDNSEDLRTGFKMLMMSEGHDEAFGEHVCKHKGPPGGEYFYQCIKEEIPRAKEEDIQWAVRIIFTQVVHKAIVMCNNAIRESMDEMGMGVPMFESDLRRLVKIVKRNIVD